MEIRSGKRTIQASGRARIAWASRNHKHEHTSVTFEVPSEKSTTGHMLVVITREELEAAIMFFRRSDIHWLSKEEQNTDVDWMK